MSTPKATKQHGGKRPGAGRKKTVAPDGEMIERSFYLDKQSYTAALNKHGKALNTLVRAFIKSLTAD